MAAIASEVKSPLVVGERELVYTRVFNAPQALVYEAWTNPMHLVHWYGPNGFRTTIHQMDVRPGGVWRLTMHGPDGRDYNNHIVFSEVEAPARLVYRHEPEPGSEPATHETTVTFTARGAQTELTMRMAFASAEALQYVVEKYHAIEGGTQTLARFESYLQMQVRAAAMPELPSLTLTRVFKAPQALVFKAWTDAEHLQHWWGPRMFTTARCELDLRLGGAFVIHMKAPNGTIYPMTGTVREVAKPERFAYDFMVPDQNGAPLFEGRTTVSFRAVGDETELTMRTEITSKAEGANQFLKGMEIGWNQSFDRLGEFVETGKVSN